MRKPKVHPKLAKLLDTAHQERITYQRWLTRLFRAAGRVLASQKRLRRLQRRIDRFEPPEARSQEGSDHASE